MKKYRFFLLGLLLITFTSCIGVSADIQMKRNGSGRIVLEYRFSSAAEAVGRLDGNERWNIIPTGRADFERTVERIDGLTLVSFSSRADAGDIVNKAVLGFNNPQALLKFLDPSGRRAILGGEGNSNSLTLILNEPVTARIDDDLLSLAKQSSAGYKVSVSFSADRNSRLTLTDGQGKALPTPQSARIIPSGRKVSMSIDTPEILNLSDGLGVIFTW